MGCPNKFPLLRRDCIQVDWTSLWRTLPVSNMTFRCLTTTVATLLSSRHSTAGFVEVMQRENFNVWLDRSRQVVLLQWLDFEYSLIQDIVDLMEYAEREQILDYDMIIDVTWSSGGSRGAYAMQRLVDEPFRVTFGNVRLSDLGKERVEREANRQLDTSAPSIFGLNLRP